MLRFIIPLLILLAAACTYKSSKERFDIDDFYKSQQEKCESYTKSNESVQESQ